MNIEKNTEKYLSPQYILGIVRKESRSLAKDSTPTWRIAHERTRFKSRRAYFCIGKGKVSDLPEFKENRAVTSLQPHRRTTVSSVLSSSVLCSTHARARVSACMSLLSSKLSQSELLSAAQAQQRTLTCDLLTERPINRLCLLESMYTTQ